MMYSKRYYRVFGSLTDLLKGNQRYGNASYQWKTGILIMVTFIGDAIADFHCSLEFSTRVLSIEPATTILSQTKALLANNTKAVQSSSPAPTKAFPLTTHLATIESSNRFS